MTTFLQFSGGKDSIVCLHLLRDRWDEMTVVWVNTGAAFPETIEYMERVRSLVPHFLEIQSSQTIAKMGYPADLVPTAASLAGRVLHPGGKFMFQSRWDCHAQAIAFPLHREMLARKATTLIRGSKRADYFHSPLEPGAVLAGIRYEFPVWEWSDEDVREFIKNNDIEMPAHYELMSSGLDCWNCTAYLSDGRGRLAYMRAHHPKKAEHVEEVLAELASEIAQESAHFGVIHGR